MFWTQKHSVYQRQTGISLVEVMIVITILAIVGSMVMTSYSSVYSTKLSSAAQLLVADLEYAQIQSMAHGDDLRVVVFDTANNQYHIGTVSDNDTPVTHPVNKAPYQLTFGEGQLSHLGMVQISNVSLDGDDVLGYNVLGNIDQATNATITLQLQDLRVDITIDASTGKASISDLY